MISGEYGIQSMPCSSQTISEILPEIHTIEKFDFLKSIVRSQVIKFSVERDYIIDMYYSPSNKCPIYNEPPP